MSWKASPEQFLGKGANQLPRLPLALSVVEFTTRQGCEARMTLLNVYLDTALQLEKAGPGRSDCASRGAIVVVGRSIEARRQKSQRAEAPLRDIGSALCGTLVFKTGLRINRLSCLPEYDLTIAAL